MAPDCGVYHGRPSSVGREISPAQVYVRGVRLDRNDANAWKAIQKIDTGVADVSAAIDNQLWRHQMTQDRIFALNKGLIEGRPIAATDPQM